ncbi:SLBB domain-containing protein [Chitinolyticbacter meiyuanensis]|uniref:SLBB domain-containing protein n=1 Tax=Chitinolyticbacter meiyuanensis TaxID=682798 RepID=UPI0011E58A55|nr:SLBB domain-containing protein [Chitinolyticbacter meiyuanensis]
MKKLIVTMFGWLLLAMVAHADNAGEYRLGPGDVVRVTVYDHADLDTEAQLTQDGKLAFPLVGLLDLNNLSFTEAAKRVSEALERGQFLRKAHVNVLITQYRSQRISVVGEVNRPGRYQLDSPTSLVDAIALAGGVSVNGGDRVVLVRGTERREVLLSQLVNPANPTADGAKVFSGDVVFVPRMQQFYVYGEVNRPGNFRLENNMTVMQALASAGGFNPRASHRNVAVHRTAGDGSVQELAVKLTDRVQENDVIYVQEALF